MSPSNVVSGFRSTGVCPFDRYAIIVPGFEEEGEEEELDDLSEKTGLAYIPLFSPAPKHQKPRATSPTSLRISFTEEESPCFQRRWESGYDLKHDQRHNHWLKLHHPDCQHPPKTDGLDLNDPSSHFPHFPGYSSDEGPDTLLGIQSTPLSSGAVRNVSSPATSVLSSLLVVPEAPAKVRTKKSGAARILTSKENLELLEVKEKKKQQLEEQKRQRKEERERKAQEREEQKKEKERIQQEKKKEQEAKRALKGKEKYKHSRQVQKCSQDMLKRGAKCKGTVLSDSEEETDSDRPGQ